MQTQNNASGGASTNESYVSKKVYGDEHGVSQPTGQSCGMQCFFCGSPSLFRAGACLTCSVCGTPQNGCGG